MNTQRIISAVFLATMLCAGFGCTTGPKGEAMFASTYAPPAVDSPPSDCSTDAQCQVDEDCETGSVCVDCACQSGEKK